MPVVALVAVGAIFGGGDKKETRQNPTTPPKSATVSSQPIVNDDKSATEQSQKSYGRPDPEELKEKANTYLSEQFNLDLVDLQDKTLRFELTVTAPGISDREDQSEAPENWDDFQIEFISAQARTSDELGISSMNTMLYLIDSESEIMLSARNGIIIENKYKEKEIITPAPSGTQPSGRTVWVTSSGKKYHYSSSCSNMKSPKSIPLSEAISKGYTACDKCA